MIVIGRHFFTNFDPYHLFKEWFEKIVVILMPVISII